jgi:hypothetical protein
LFLWWTVLFLSFIFLLFLFSFPLPDFFVISVARFFVSFAYFCCCCQISFSGWILERMNRFLFPTGCSILLYLFHWLFWVVIALYLIPTTCSIQKWICSLSKCWYDKKARVINKNE